MKTRFAIGLAIITLVFLALVLPAQATYYYTDEYFGARFGDSNLRPVVKQSSNTMHFVDSDAFHDGFGKSNLKTGNTGTSKIVTINQTDSDSSSPQIIENKSLETNKTKVEDFVVLNESNETNTTNKTSAKLELSFDEDELDSANESEGPILLGDGNKTLIVLSEANGTVIEKTPELTGDDLTLGIPEEVKSLAPTGALLTHMRSSQQLMAVGMLFVVVIIMLAVLFTRNKKPKKKAKKITNKAEKKELKADKEAEKPAPKTKEDSENTKEVSEPVKKNSAWVEGDFFSQAKTKKIASEKKKEESAKKQVKETSSPKAKEPKKESKLETKPFLLKISED